MKEQCEKCKGLGNGVILVDDHFKCKECGTDWSGGEIKESVDSQLSKLREAVVELSKGLDGFIAGLKGEDFKGIEEEIKKILG